MRKLSRFETLLTSTFAGSALVLALLSAGSSGCSLGDADDEGDTGDGDGDGDGPPPPPPPPPIDGPAIYKRGSLAPLFELTPQNEQNRFLLFDVALDDDDFIADGGGFTSVAQKLDEIGDQIGAERELGTIDLVGSADQLRADEMPFRGNPSDVDIIRLGDTTRAFVPLGGSVGVPGNEVAVVDIGEGDVARRIKVGIRPVRTAVHPDGVVFVCNMYSNYISVIDAFNEEVFENTDGTPLEIPTDFYCSDILVAEADQPGGDFDDRIHLYVANQWRAVVQRYELEIVRDNVNDRVIGVNRVNVPTGSDPISKPDADIGGVGNNPQRLKLSEDQGRVYVANGRGGEVARIDTRDDSDIQRTAIGAPSADIVQFNNSVFVATMMPDRGLLDEGEEVIPEDAQANPVTVTGISGESVVAHPGALFDQTASYNFEDIRSGVQQLDQNLTGLETYYTDNNSPEPNFNDQQLRLSGAQPVAAERNLAGTKLFLAHSGSDFIQELDVNGGANFRLEEVGGGEFQTEQRPFAMLVDEVVGRADNFLLVASWGGGVLEVFSLEDRNEIEEIDLGYAFQAAAPYPATNIERGEYLYYNAEWSNNGRKSCAGCHTDELLADGFGFSNGVTAPTAMHGVRPNFNLMTTDNYFWNGSFDNGSYASLAFTAQTRTNCELIVFGLVEGPSSDPDGRIGDPVVQQFSNGNDAACRPDAFDPTTGLPENFAAIAVQIALEKQTVAVNIAQTASALLGIDVVREDVSRFTDWYSVSQIRLPPNPLNYLYEAKELSPATEKKIDDGRVLFEDIGCASCHSPSNARAPYTDGLEHGPGAEWQADFVARYSADPRVDLPDQLIDALDDSPNDDEINLHIEIDFFKPFCFDQDECLVFEDPIASAPGSAEEDRKLELLNLINLDDPERGFVPGNVVGQARINTPSLRAVWWNAAYLHHGLARTIYEAILGPGHPELRDGEIGYATNSVGSLEAHGETQALTAVQVESLVLFLESIE